MRILALDCATSTGWAISDDDTLVGFGTMTFELRRGESAGMRFLRFDAWLEDLWKLAGPFDLVRFERAHHRGGAATELCVGFTTRVMSWAAKHGAEYEGVPTGTWKKQVVGKGNADKEECRAAVIVAWNDALTSLRRSPANFDESDALGILAYDGR